MELALDGKGCGGAGKLKVWSLLWMEKGVGGGEIEDMKHTTSTIR